MRYSEFSLIDYIKRSFGELTPLNIIGIGDDCAVLPYVDGQSLVVTSDMLVENIHFLADKITPYELGRKSVTVNLSDIAAMGANPIGMTLSIALPKWIEDAYIQSFMHGVMSFNIPLLGGDTTRSAADFVINITAIGVAPKENIKLRSSAKLGDTIYVTGCLGDSSAGLYALQNNIAATELIRAHHNPTPHLTQGLELGKNTLVHAMMDVSDGIASDLRHILDASGVSAVVDTKKIPLSNTLIDFCNHHQTSAIDHAVAGGEDYVLLFTASDNLVVDFPTYPIGRITQNTGGIEWLPSGDYKGFTHF